MKTEIKNTVIEVPMWEAKCWGSVRHDFYSDDIGVSRLNLDPGFCCSIHYHDDRVNQFTVIEGSICIEWWPVGMDRTKRMKVLCENETLMIPTKIWHRFRTMSGGKMIEMYWPQRTVNKVHFDDIIRHDKGGKDDLVQLEHELEEFDIS